MSRPPSSPSPPPPAPSAPPSTERLSDTQRLPPVSASAPPGPLLEGLDDGPQERCPCSPPSTVGSRMSFRSSHSPSPSPPLTPSSVSCSRTGSPRSLRSLGSPSPERMQNPGQVNHIPIYVETLTGVTFEMQVLPSETIFSVKMKLQTAEGIAASQQHLLWQGEELKDDYTLDEYNIGFGAILKLVLGLRGGPINKSPSIVFENDPLDEQDQVDDGSRPLTVLVFQNGDQIRMFTIGTGTTVTTGGSGGRGGHNRGESGAASSETGARSQSKTPSADRRRRDDENRALKQKLEDLQEKMKRLHLMRNKNKPNTKLPSIQGIVTQKKSTVETTNTAPHPPPPPATGVHKAPLHFPPIISHSVSLSAGKLTSTTSIATKAPPKLGKSERGPEMKSFRQLVESIQKVRRVRSNSLSPTGVCTLLASRVKLSKNKRIFFRLKTPSASSNRRESVETSTVGSIGLPATQKERPQTSPLIGKINELREIPSVKELQKFAIMNTVSRRQSVRLHSPAPFAKARGKKHGPPILPSVVPAKRCEKMRCFRCNRKLGLAAKYECRCGSTFCSTHRYSEAHNCSFDYKKEGRKLIELNNPLIRRPKLPKI